jgi:MFS transporter, DHA1 family, multidrug resistance protein
VAKLYSREIPRDAETAGLRSAATWAILLIPFVMSTSTSRPSGDHHGLAALLAALAAVGPFSIDAYLPSMGEIQRVLHASPYAAQLTLTAYLVPFAAMMLWHGAISDAVGRRPVILWGFALFGLASLACAFAQSIEMLLFFRVLQGMTAGAGMVVGRAIVRDRYQGADAQRVMSQVSLTFAIAPAVAPVVGGWLQVWFGWRAVFVFTVVFCAAIWLTCRVVLEETLPPERRQSLHPVYLAKAYWKVLTSLRFVAACIALMLNFSGMFIYVTSAPVFLMQHLGVSETGFLWLFGPITAGSAIGAWICGKVAGRISPWRALGWAYGVMAAAATANLVFHLLHPPALPWSVLPLFFYAIGMSLTFPTLTLLALDLFPTQRGLAASCQSFISTTGAALIAALAPLVWGSALTLATTSLLLLLGGLAAVFAFRKLDHGATPPTIESVADVEMHL